MCLLLFLLLAYNYDNGFKVTVNSPPEKLGGFAITYNGNPRGVSSTILRIALYAKEFHSLDSQKNKHQNLEDRSSNSFPNAIKKVTFVTFFYYTRPIQ